MDHNDEYEDLLQGLRDVLAVLDPVPARVIEAGRGAFAWRRVDAELAELLADSASEATDTNALALARGGGAEVRAVSFGSGDIVIELEIHAQERERTILGQLSPPSTATVDVEGSGHGSPVSATADTFGRFRIRLPEGGPIRVRITDAAAAAGPIVTSWIVV